MLTADDITKYQLTRRELADLYGVSRVTINNWRRGEGRHSLIHDRAEQIDAALASAYEAAHLPLRQTERAAREQELRGIMERFS